MSKHLTQQPYGCTAYIIILDFLLFRKNGFDIIRDVNGMIKIAQLLYNEGAIPMLILNAVERFEDAV